MIDLHVHTTFSDGKETLEQVLQRAERLGMTAISITDHDTVAAYEALKDPKVRGLFSGKILVGTELSTVLDGILVHIKGFGFDPTKMAKALAKKNVIHVSDFWCFVKQEMQAVFDKHGIEADFSHCKTHCDVAREVLKLIHLLPVELDVTSETTDNKVSILYWKYMYKPNNALSLPLEKMFMSTQDAIALIRECGGKAVVAHPRQYYNFADHVLNALVDKVDGIECFHWSANPEYREKLLQICRDNNLIVTGGTDFHACGKRDLNHEQIPAELINQFKKFV